MIRHADDVARLTTEEIRAWCAADLGYVAERDDLGYTPLIAACDRGNTAVVRALLAAGADPNFTAADGESPLKSAVPSPGGAVDLELFDLLLDAGACPNAGLEPPLHIAVVRGHRALVAHLIRRGADPNHEDADGCPPLFWAGVYGDGRPDLEMMRLLVAHGADVTRRDGIGRHLGDRIGPHALRFITERTHP
jgi:ankyrin repeat protein